MNCSVTGMESILSTRNQEQIHFQTDPVENSRVIRQKTIPGHYLNYRSEELTVPNPLGIKQALNCNRDCLLYLHQSLFEKGSVTISITFSTSSCLHKLRYKFYNLLTVQLLLLYLLVSAEFSPLQSDAVSI